MGYPVEVIRNGDNYIYLLRFGEDRALVVDPGRADIVLQAIQNRRLRSMRILLTHHHGDHTGGVAELKRRIGCRVYGTDKIQIPLIDEVVVDGQILTMIDLNILVIATPGHTRDSVCYYIPTQTDQPNPILFTGDTLFAGGCGRVLECDAGTMWRSLGILAALPNETRVYCGHEYAAENFRFATKFNPKDAEYLRRLREVQVTLRLGHPTVPFTIEEEKRSNIFLRARDAKQFAHLRGLKDRF